MGLRRIFRLLLPVALLVSVVDIGLLPVHSETAGATNPVTSFTASFCEVPPGQQLPSACGGTSGYGVVLKWASNPALTSLTIWGSSLGNTTCTVNSQPPSKCNFSNSTLTVPVAQGGDDQYTLEATDSSGTPYYASTEVVVPDLAPPTITPELNGTVSGQSIAVDAFPATSGPYNGDYLDMRTGQPAQFGWSGGGAPSWAPGASMVTEIATNPNPLAPNYVQQTGPSGTFVLPPSGSSSVFNSSPQSAQYQTAGFSVRTCVPDLSFCSGAVGVTATLTGAQFQGGFREFTSGSNTTLSWSSPAGQITPGAFWVLGSSSISGSTHTTVLTNPSYTVPTAAGQTDFYLLSCTFTACAGSLAMGSGAVNANNGQTLGTVSWSVPTPVAFVNAGDTVGTLTLSGSLTCAGTTSNVCPLKAPATGIMGEIVPNGGTVSEATNPYGSTSSQTQNIFQIATTEQELVGANTATMTQANFTQEPWTSGFNTTTSKAYSTADTPGIGLPTKTATDPSGNVFVDGEFDSAIGEVSSSGQVSSYQVPLANQGNQPMPPQTTPYYSSVFAGGPVSSSQLGEGMIYADGRVWAIQGGDLIPPGHSNHSRIVSFAPNGPAPTQSPPIPGDYNSNFCVYSVPGNDNSVYDLTWDGKYIWFTDEGNGADANAQNHTSNPWGTLDYFDPSQETCDSMLSFDTSQYQPDQYSQFSIAGAHQYCAMGATPTSSCMAQVPTFRASSANGCNPLDKAALKLVPDPSGGQIWYDGFGGALGEVSYNGTTGSVTSTQQWDCGSGYPTPSTGDGNAGDWNMVADSTNVYWTEFNQNEIVKFNKATGVFSVIPLPMAQQSDGTGTLGIIGDRLYFASGDGWGPNTELGYISISSWNSGQPTGTIYTGLANGPNALSLPANAEMGGSALDGLSINATTGAMALADFYRKQVLELQPVTYVAAPSQNATVSGTSSALDAVASDGPGITKVQFVLNGGSVHNDIIATGALSWIGYLATWDTTSVPNGTYSLQSVATDAAGNINYSDEVTTITVSN